MTQFLRRLPAPTTGVSLAVAAIDAPFKDGEEFVTKPQRTADTLATRSSGPPPYGARESGWAPRCQADFGDGGAFPEVLVAQFPLSLGKSSAQNRRTVALRTGADGKLDYGAVVTQNSDKKITYTRAADQKALWSSADELSKPGETEAIDNLERTKAALEGTLCRKVNESQVAGGDKRDPTYIRYTPSEQAPGHNANCSQRIIRVIDKQVDPIEPTKFRHKRIPRGAASPPPPIQHSPPKKLTQKDQQEWKIPPCVSNWKNQKGYTVPLDKRVQADGRSLKDVTVNDKFAALSDALYVAERNAREEIRARNEVLKKKKAFEEEMREEELRKVAIQSRAERSNLQAMHNRDTETDEARIRRQEIEYKRKREIERDIRLEKAGKKRNRDGDRDISERVALGMAQPTSVDAMYDARLYNQSQGLDSGYSTIEDEDRNNIYDKALFADRSSTHLYHFDKDRMQQSLGEQHQLPTFAGADRNKTRSAPVEFEKDAQDPFGLDTLLSEAKKK